MEDTFIDDLVLKERTSHLGYIGAMSGSVQDSGDRRRNAPTFLDDHEYVMRITISGPDSMKP